MLAPLEKLAKADCPNAGLDPDLAAQGDVLIPNWEDWPNPNALGLPKARPESEGGLPKLLEPNIAPPVAAGLFVDAAHELDCWPSREELPKVGAVVGVVEAKGELSAVAKEAGFRGVV